VHIDLAALRHNLHCIRQTVPGSKILAMIKCNAYGHGAFRVAKALGKADAFGVASVQEACELRQTGVTNPIVVMSGFFDATELHLLCRWQLEPVLHHTFQLELLEQHALPHPVKAWVKFNSGMNRLGFHLQQFHSVMQRIQQCPSICQPVTLMTHLAQAAVAMSPFTQHQINLFRQAASQYPEYPVSIANSAAILIEPRAHADWVRPGLMLYGAAPVEKKPASAFSLRPVMTFKARIMSFQDCLAGDAVGYDCTYHCPEAMRIAIVAVGYGDGYPRHAAIGTPTLVHGKVCPLVGRVSMDMIALDMRECRDAKVGDEVTLWGEGLPIETIAEHCGTISYELFCQVSERVERRYHE